MKYSLFLVVFFLTIILIMSEISNHREQKIASLEQDKKNLEIENQKLKKQLHVDNDIIKSKINDIQQAINKDYPDYEVDINDIPSDLRQIYIQEKFIIPHGLKNYQLSIKNMRFPIDTEYGYCTTKFSEFAGYRKHAGIDIKNPYNDSVYAISDAIVYNVYYTKNGGWTIEIKFQSDNNWYFSRFLHLEKIFVKIGDTIKKNDLIASMGKTGLLCHGKHLHWELWQYNSGKWININPVINSTWNNKIVEIL